MQLLKHLAAAVINLPAKKGPVYFYWKKFCAGMSFPFDFGFVPSTLAADGDPLDILIVSEEKLFPGCLIQARIPDAMKCKEGAKGKLECNDRLIAAPILENVPVKINLLKELGGKVPWELENFFVFQHTLEGKQFKMLEIVNQHKALNLVKQTLTTGSKRK